MAADFNNDGRLDLVKVHRNLPTTAALLLNQGNGAFEAVKFLTLNATQNLSLFAQSNQFAYSAHRCARRGVADGDEWQCRRG